MMADIIWDCDEDPHRNLKEAGRQDVVTEDSECEEEVARLIKQRGPRRASPGSEKKNPEQTGIGY